MITASERRRQKQGPFAFGRWGVRQTLLAGGVLACCAGQGISRAQDAPAAPADQPGAPVGLEEIIVTARRREERLQDVPVAITAFRESDLARYGTDSIYQIAAQTPQLLIGSAVGPAGLAINLRGVGSSIASPSVDQSVSINIDGIQLSQSNSLKLGLFDLGQVEILKGPQALFFGKNSPGGVISLTSADPGDSFESYMQAGYEFENKQEELLAVVSSPLTDTLSVRIAASASYESGWFRNLATPIYGEPATPADTAPEGHEYFVRGTLKFRPSDAFDASLKVSAAKQLSSNGLMSGAQLFSCPLGRPQLTALLPGTATDCSINRYYNEPNFTPAAAATDPDFYGTGSPYSDNQLFLASLTTNWQVSDALTLTSVTGYVHSDDQWDTNFSGGELETLLTGADTTVGQVTEELRLASHYDSPINYLVGGFYQNSALDLGIPVTFGSAIASAELGPDSPPVLAAADYFRQLTHAYSFFAQGLWKFTPQWELTAGARYSHETKDEHGLRYPSLLSGFTTTPFTFAPDQVTFHNLSPEVTLSYKPVTNLTLYGAYRQGFSSGGFNLSPLNFSGATINHNSFDQETVRGGEFGLKGTLADRQLQLDVTAYLYKYENLQLTAFDPETVSLNVLNAGTSTVKGVEATLAYAPNQIRGLVFRASPSFNVAKYDSYDNAGCYAGQTQALGCTGDIVAGVASSQSLSGRPLQNAPRVAFTAGSTYEMSFRNGASLSPSVEAQYSGSYYSQPTESPYSLQSSAWRFNAGLTYRAPNDAWQLALIGRNLTNVLRVISAFDLPFTGYGTGTTGPALRADLAGSVSDPRAILLQFKITDAVLR